MPENTKPSGELEQAQTYNLTQLIDYGEGAVVSRTIKKSVNGTITIFSFDQGQELSEHTAPFDAYVLALEGQVKLTIGGKTVIAKAGEIVLMPANVPHALFAEQKFKMLLTMIKEPKA